jgi:hypothetical protein
LIAQRRERHAFWYQIRETLQILWLTAQYWRVIQDGGAFSDRPIDGDLTSPVLLCDPDHCGSTNQGLAAMKA